MKRLNMEKFNGLVDSTKNAMYKAFNEKNQNGIKEAVGVYMFLVLILVDELDTVTDLLILDALSSEIFDLGLSLIRSL